MTFKSLFTASIAAAAVAGVMSATVPASAAETMAKETARALDSQSAEFTMSAAKERRLEIIDETNRQLSGRGYGRRGYGGDPGYGRGYREERVYRDDRGFARGPGYGRGYYE